MSYILDALNKAENERQIGSVPTLDSQHQNVLVEKKPNRNLIIFISVIMLLNLGLVANYFYYKDDSQPNVVSRNTSTPIRNNSPVVDSVVKNSVENAVENLAKNPANKRPPAPITVIPAAIAPGALIAEVKTLPTVIKQRAVLEDERIPYLSEKSDSFQQTIPDLKIDVHVYSETPANRFILINLQRYQVDDQIAKGLMLEAITEEGIILSFNQEKFRFIMATD